MTEEEKIEDTTSKEPEEKMTEDENIEDTICNPCLNAICSLLPKEPEESKKKPEITKQPDPILIPREEIEKFLHERCVSECLIRTLLKIGFTDEFVRLLKAMGFTDEDITMLQNLWSLDLKDPEETDSSVSLPSSSGEYLSSDGLYLKKLLSKPLANALREIVTKKPFDPVDYLGHWLLNYKIYEERGRRQREWELELLIERERLRPHVRITCNLLLFLSIMLYIHFLGSVPQLPVRLFYLKKGVEDEVFVPTRCEEEEEHVEDWNYLNYEG